MCGICGLLDGQTVRLQKEKLIRKMNAAQHHRGPDDDGIFAEGPTALGHVRLSILDLSPAGHQPMLQGDRYAFVFNGEIFNYIELRKELKKNGYSFHTETDTEVALAALDFWGQEALKRFNGFWAFALYDRKKEKILLSRDRYGVKPLYYTRQSGYLIFASELKALLTDEKIQRKTCDQAVLDYLVNGFVDCEEETFVQDVFHVPAGYWMEFSRDGNVRKERYDSMIYKERMDGKVTPEMEREFRRLFEDSVSLRLRADVPVGSCLSGGLDSSAIVCASSRILRERTGKNEQKVFSACYPGRPEDESRYIDEIVKDTGVECHKVTPAWGDLAEDLDHLIYTQDEPFLSTSMYASYCVMRLAKRNHTKVLLDGQGADELLCGYRKARVYYIRKMAKEHHGIRALWEALLYLPYMRKKNFSLVADLSALRQFLGKESGADIRRRYLAEPLQEMKLRNSYQDNERFLINDFEKISLPALLRYVDRNSMAFSIEDRLPFLDYRFVNLCMSLPMGAKIRNGWSKYIMRKSMDLPKLIRRRRDKIGFYTPENEWIRKNSEEFRGLFENEKDFRADHYINRRKLLEDWDRLTAGKDRIGIFRYICLEKWMRIFQMES